MGETPAVIVVKVGAVVEPPLDSSRTIFQPVPFAPKASCLRWAFQSFRNCVPKGALRRYCL